MKKQNIAELVKIGRDITHLRDIYRTPSERDNPDQKEIDFPESLDIKLKRIGHLKYGENPNQLAAMYVIEMINNNNAALIAELTNVRYVRDDQGGKGGLSLTNKMDITRGMDTLKFYIDIPAVVILKHNTVSAFARQTDNQTMTQLFRSARDADLESNFGGSVIFNKPLDMETAKALYELKGINPFFVDVLAAPGYEEGVLGYVQGQSKNVRIAEFSALKRLPKFAGDETYGLLSFKALSNGEMGVQDIFLSSLRTVDDFALHPYVIDKEGNTHIIQNVPTRAELEDLLTAWRINCTGARSNGVVFVKDGVTVAVGSGQVARVYAVKDAIEKGMQKAMDREAITYDKLMGIRGYKKLSENPFKGAVCASDGFFPFGDSLLLFRRVDVKVVCQPYGSERDMQVIDAANKLYIAMPATLERCFGHF